MLEGEVHLCSYPGIAYLGAVGIDGPGAINLAQLALHVGEAQTHISGVLVWKDLIQKQDTEVRTENRHSSPTLAQPTPTNFKITHTLKLAVGFRTLR